MTKKLLYLLPITLMLVPLAASAHVGIGPTFGFWYGFLHPLGGFDHILAMVGVGLWARQTGGRAVWAVPLAFVSVMIVGGVLGASGITLPFVEQAVVMSVLIVGVLIAAAIRLPLIASTLLVGLFAIFHGHVHGAEMPLGQAGILYGVGFILTTALLHGSGVALGTAFHKNLKGTVVRYTGATIALAGAYLTYLLIH